MAPWLLKGRFPPTKGRVHPCIATKIDKTASAVAKVELADRRTLRAFPVLATRGRARVWRLRDFVATPTRQGAGSVLMRELVRALDQFRAWMVLDLAPRDGLTAEGLAEFYERFGFTRCDVPPGGMVRRPRPATARRGVGV